MTPYFRESEPERAGTSDSVVERWGATTVPSINGTPVPRRRFLGAYYTPADVAEVLARWAIGDSKANVLDPSFGGCAFMQAAASVLKSNGCARPESKVFGIDVDHTCVQYVRETLGLLESNCMFRDFLALRPADVPGAPFQAIVGNPPYVRHHWLKDERRAVARRITEESGQRLPETASLWAYFVLHALAFLRVGGKMAMLVPEAILQADYAITVRSTLARHFAKVSLIHLRQRLFKGTDEPVVVIAGEGFGEAGQLDVHSVETADELDAFLNRRARVRPEETLPNGRRIAKDALAVLQCIGSSKRTIRFGDLATVRIGIVTGANNHFIRSAEDLQEVGVPPSATLPILSRTKWLSGLAFTADDHSAIAESGASAFLVHPTAATESAPGVRLWIQQGLQVGVDEHHKCATRDPWYRVDLPPKPDAFVTSTRIGPPRLVINRGEFRCTNSLYAATWKSKCETAPEVIALGFLTTFVALWSEVNGRRYGGGVLKMDVTTLARLPVPIAPDAIGEFQRVDAVLREGDETAARELADDAVLRRGLNMSSREVDLMREALLELTRQRLPRGDGA